MDVVYWTSTENSIRINLEISSFCVSHCRHVAFHPWINFYSDKFTIWSSQANRESKITYPTWQEFLLSWRNQNWNWLQHLTMLQSQIPESSSRIINSPIHCASSAVMCLLFFDEFPRKIENSCGWKFRAWKLLSLTQFKLLRSEKQSSLKVNFSLNF